MKVWIVGLQDYGDGWSIAGVFDSREKAEQWMADNPEQWGYYQIEDNWDDNDGWEVQ